MTNSHLKDSGLFHAIRFAFRPGRWPTLPAVFSIAIAGSALAAPEAKFVHPGGLHTLADLDRMKSKVAAGEHPWIDGWNLLVKDRKAQDDWKARPAANMGSRQRAQDDATAMYYNALRWYISGDKNHAECAVGIANDWASKVSERPYGDDLSGIPIGSFALAAEVLRVYPGWAESDFEKFKEMMLKYWYPKSSGFLKYHRGDPVSRSWANWDACNMLAVLGIGVLCDDRAKFEEAVDYFKNGPGMGSIENAVPFIYPGGLGQWQESGRDWAHAMGGQGLLSEFCQMAWNQNVDLFGYDGNRLLKGAEYTAQFTLWKGVPYTYYTNADRANQGYISTNYKGRLDASHFELLYNHYVVRQGLTAPNVKAFAEMKRPEPGEIDIFGYGTLTFTLDAKASPCPAFGPPPAPQDLTATPGIGRVDLAWSPSGAYTAHGYEVWRATSPTGPITSIHATTRWTTPAFTDTKVENGRTYYYAVAALNQAGTSEKSAPVMATPVAAGALPAGWTYSTLGKEKAGGQTQFSQAAGCSFIVDAAGGGMGGTADTCNFASTTVRGNFTITARLIDRRGGISRTGVMMREGLDPKAKAVALTLGDAGGRQARFGSRAKAGEKMASQSGNDYTWLPIWFRIRREGNTFTASQSPDGMSWFTVGESTVQMPASYQAGLAACGGKGSAVTFDNVMLEVKPPPAPAAPAALAASPGKDEVRLTWKNNAINHAGTKVEAAWENGIFYEIADLAAGATSFVNTGLTHGAPVGYRVRAYNTGGYSEYSNSVGIDNTLYRK
jgi:hypothetical protein